jgi:hypothetical protein
MKIIIYLCIYYESESKGTGAFCESQKAPVPFVKFSKGTCAFCEFDQFDKKAPVPSVNSQKAPVPFDSLS